MAGKNLLVNGKNNITARANAMANIQNTMANRTTATNVNTTPNLPTPTTNVTLRKAAQPVQTPIVQNNAMNNLNTKIVQPAVQNTTAGGVGTVAPIPQQQSRFIGLQQQPTGKSMANLTKSALYIPTAGGTAGKANKKEENKFRTTEQALLDFQADVLKKKGKMKDADIKRLYPEFADRLDVMKELQTELRPIVKNGQGVDGEQLAQYYPELIQPKNLQDVEAIKKQSDTSNKKLQSNIQKVEKVVTENFDVLSPDGQKYVQDYLTLAGVIDSLKKNYRIVGGANDDEILQYAIENNPQLKGVADELQRLTLSEMDKATIDGNSLSIITSMISGLQKMTRQASNAVQNFAAEQNYLAEQDGTNQPNVFNTTWNTAANILGAADQATTATARFFGNQNVNYNIDKEAQEAVEKQEVSDLLAMGGGYWKTIWGIATAPFEYGKLNPITKPVVEGVVEPVFEGISTLEKTITNPVWDAVGFNEQDKENADAILLGEIFRESKNVKKDVKVRAEAVKDIVSDAFKRTVKSNKRSEMKNEFQKAGVYDEAGYIKPEARTQAAKIIAKEFAKDFTENFKNDAKQWGDVVDFYRKKEGVKSYKEQVQEFKEGAKNVVDSVKETGKNVGKKIETGIDKGFDKMDESIEKGIDNLRNKVTKGKTTEIKAEETAPIKDTAGWSQPKKGVVSKVVGGVTAVGNKINEKVVDPLSTKVAEGITSTTAPQDKLFKALNPSINVLSRKKGNYDTIRKNADRANELIVEYGDAPTNSKDYYDSIVNTKKKIWNNGIQQGLDEYKYTTIDAKDLINPVREALKEFTAEPLEALKGDVKKLEAELQAIESKGIISLLEMETKKRQINAILEYGLPPDASQIYEKGMRELNRQIGIQEDRMISELPGEFSKFKRDYGALTAIEEDAQKLMIKDMKKKLGGNLIQNWSRIEGLGKMGKAMVGNGSFLEGAAQIILGESLGKVKDTNFLIKSGFEGLRGQYKGGTTKPEGVKIKKKPPTPKLEDKRTDVEKGKLLEIDKRTKSNREEGYKTKNAVTSEKSAVTEKKTEPKAEAKKPEIKEEKKEEQPKQEIKNKVTAEKPVKKSEPKKKTNVEKFREETAKYYPDYQSIENGARDMAESILRDAGVDAEIVDLVFTGSKARGLEHDTSDFDILIELKGNDLREDSLFDLLNDEDLNDEYDFNPILADKTGTLEDVVLDQEKYMSNKRVIKEIADEYGIKWDKELADDAGNMHGELIKNFLDRTEGPIEFSTHGDGEVAGALDTKLYKQNPQNMSNTFYIGGVKRDMEFLKKIKRPETENSKAYAKLFEVKEEPKNVVTQKATVTTKKPAAKKTTTAKEQLQAIVNKYKDIQMDDFSDENSEGGGVNSQKFKNFAKELKKAYQAVATEDNMELTDYNVGYYNVTAFFKNNEGDTGQYYYVSLGDVRDPEWRNGILYRTARDSKDYHGGSNQYTDLENLAEALKGNKSVASSRETNTKNFMANLQRDLDNSPIITMNNGKLNKVTAEDVVKKEEKSEGNAFGLKEQKGSSRINNFTNVVKKIIDKYSDDIEGDNLFIELGEPYLPLEIDYEAGKKQLIVRHPNLGYDDPAIRFTVGEDGKLQPTGIKQAFMEQMMDNWDWSPIKETDELLHTWAVNLEDQYLNERNIDEDTGIMKTTTEITGDKNAVTAKTVAKSENQNIIGKNNSLTTKPTTNEGNRANSNGDTQGQGELSNTKGVLGESEGGRQGVSEKNSVTRGEKTLMSSENDNQERGNGSRDAAASKSIRTKGDDVITTKTVTQARDINRDCVSILENHKFSTNPEDYTLDEIETLKQYEGRGGVNDKADSETQGALNQYYTKDNIIKAMWRLLDGYNNKDILEPSMGVGRFFMYAPEGSNLAGFEYDKIPGTIAKILYPNADIKIGDFQDNFMLGKRSMGDTYTGKKYDIVIGNPPYEERQGRHKSLGEEPKINRFDDYFIKRGIDMLKPGGHLAFVTSSQFLRGADNYAKQMISKNADLIDAYRIPVGAFDRTGVETDIIVFEKKEGGGDNSLLSASKWFDKHPEKILGEERNDIQGRFGPKTAVVGDLAAIDDIAQAHLGNDGKPAMLETKFTPNKVETEKPKNTITAKKAGVTTKAQPKVKTARPEIKEQDWVEWTMTKQDKDGNAVKVPIGRSYMGVLFKGKPGQTTGKLVVGKGGIGKYQNMLNANGRIGDPNITIESDREGLNYIEGELEPNVLYASGNIPNKLAILEQDYKLNRIDEKQYNKQKDLLQQAMPEPIDFQEIDWSPYSAWVLDTPTESIASMWKNSSEGYVDRAQTVRELFTKWISNRDKELGTVTVSHKNSKTGEITYSQESLANAMIKALEGTKSGFAKEMEDELTVKLPENFTKFMKEGEVDDNTKQKLQDEFNRRFNNYKNFDYSELGYTIDDVSENYWTPSDVQARGIARILTTESLIVAYGVGQGKTFTGAEGAIASMQQGKATKCLIIVPIGTKADWMKTIAENNPNQEIVDLGTLAPGSGARERLSAAFGHDPRNWIKPGQIGILVDSALGKQISFKPDTLAALQEKLTDVTNTPFSKETAAQKLLKEKEKLESENNDYYISNAQLEKNKKKLESIIGKLEEIDSTKTDTAMVRKRYSGKALPDEGIDQALAHIEEDYDEYVSNMTKYLDENPDVNKDKARPIINKIYDNERAIYLEELGIDHVTVDEAHNYRNLFNKSMDADEEGEGGAWRASVDISKGSAAAMNLYGISQYIMEKNNGGNVVLLTATPFINEPSEVYNMLAYVGKNGMEEMGVSTIDDFFDAYVGLTNKLILKPSGTDAKNKNVMLQFNNTRALVGSLLDRYIDYEGESDLIVKPRQNTYPVRLKMGKTQDEIQKKLEVQIDDNKFDDMWRDDNVYVVDKDGNTVPLSSTRKLDDKGKARGAVIEGMGQANSDLISPYLSKYLKSELPNLTPKELIDTSPKLKAVTEIIKAVRDFGIKRGVFVYMPIGTELHELLQKAIELENPGVRVGIINGDPKYADMTKSQAEKLGLGDAKGARARETGKKFSDGEIDVLIGGENTKEGLNLQGNGYITIEVSQPRNPNDRIQLHGRVWRRGNKSNEVLVIPLLMENSSDIYRFQRMQHKNSRWTLLEMLSAYKNGEEIDNLKPQEDMDLEEQKLALFTDPERKAKVSIIMDKAELSKQSQTLNGAIKGLESVKTIMETWGNARGRYKDYAHDDPYMDLKDESGKVITSNILEDNALEPLEQKLEYYHDKAARKYAERHPERNKAEIEKAIQKESPYNSDASEYNRVKRYELAQARGDRNSVIRQMNALGLKTLEELEAHLAKLHANKEALDNKIKNIEDTKQERIDKFQKEIDENAANAMDLEDIIEDLKEEFKHQLTFQTEGELRDWLKATENLPKRKVATSKSDIAQGLNKYSWESKDYVGIKPAVTETRKNKVTSNFAQYNEENQKPEFEFNRRVPKQTITKEDGSWLTKFGYQKNLRNGLSELKQEEKEMEQKAERDNKNKEELLKKDDYYLARVSRIQTNISKLARQYAPEIIEAYEIENPDLVGDTTPENFLDYVNDYKLVDGKVDKIPDDLAMAGAEILSEKYKEYLENGEIEEETPKNIIANDKNKVTTQAARANRPSIRMNVEEREKKNPTANPMNKVTSKKPTQNTPMKFSPELVSKIDKLAEERGLEGNTIKKMKVLNKEVDKGKGYQTETEKEIYNLKKQIIIEYVKSKLRTIKDKGQKKTIVDIKQGKTRVHWHVVGKLYRDLKREGIIK